MQNTEKTLVPSIPVKRKGEEYQTLGKKRRGRGRPPTYSNFDRVDGMAPPPVSSRPSSPVNVPTQLPTPQSATPPSTTVATTDALHCHLLPAASMPRLSRIQVCFYPPIVTIHSHHNTINTGKTVKIVKW